MVTKVIFKMAMTGHGHTNRQRLRPWLIDQINSGSYPGLRWIDQEQMIFQISWKHFGKPGVNEERDAKIFREWARHTGKFKSGDPPDPSTWKTRFRCALYKLQDIEEMSSMNMLDGEEPYRVYRFKSKGINYIIQVASTLVLTLFLPYTAYYIEFFQGRRGCTLVCKSHTVATESGTL